ncbi:hypothetical protein E2C01_004740 [Portunus trituberculatus]|uniref:Uncharacterized protein n=1 Tax=Portunus trituberculatus TaxID=210409 RepID=A0A5B7CX84_PORTR|nr:hypothetical protein [Portunus trituberculatus]
MMRDSGSNINSPQGSGTWERLPAGNTPISCSRGLNGVPRLNFVFALAQFVKTGLPREHCQSLQQASPNHLLEDPTQASSIFISNVLPELHVIGQHPKLGFIIAVFGSRLIQSHFIRDFLLLLLLHTVDGPLHTTSGHPVQRIELIPGPSHSSSYSVSKTNQILLLKTYVTCQGKKDDIQFYGRQEKQTCLTKLATDITWFGFVWFELLPDDGEVDLVGSQAQHDEVSVSATQHMLGVWVMVWLCSLLADEVHDLVLSLTRHIGIREDHLPR